MPLVGFGRVYGGAGEFAKWTQTVALLEVVHAALGTYFSSCSWVLRWGDLDFEYWGIGYWLCENGTNANRVCLRAQA